MAKSRSAPSRPCQEAELDKTITNTNGAISLVAYPINGIVSATSVVGTIDILHETKWKQGEKLEEICPYETGTKMHQRAH
jgi:hypothetical protein